MADIVLSSAVAAYEPVGSEFLVNSSTANNQFQSTITGLPGGGFVVIWSDGSPIVPGNPYDYDVKGQMYAADGSPVGGEFLVNTITSSFQALPAVTALEGGGFVVSWTDGSLINGYVNSTEIRAQIFAADGSPVGGEFAVNSTIFNWQEFPTITGLAGGGFVISWMDGSSGVPGNPSGTDVRAQIFASDGARIGDEFVVNSTTSNFQEFPTIAALAGGGFVVAWGDSSGLGEDSSGTSVKAQIYAADGSPVGGEFLVNSVTVNAQYYPTIAGLDGGGFVVSWQCWNEAGTQIEIKAQIFAADGSRVGGEFQVNVETLAALVEPTITGLDGGGFVISWATQYGAGADPSEYGLRAQVFAADGSPVGGQFVVNSSAASGQLEPAIARLDGGGFVISWTDPGGTGGDSSGYAVKAQIYAGPPPQAPVNSVPGAQSVDEDATLAFTVANGNAVSISDADAGPSDVLDVTLSVLHGALTMTTTTGLTFTSGDGTGDATMTFHGTQSDINTALATLSYAPAAGYSGSDSLSITTNDVFGAPGGLQDADAVAITVNPVSDYEPVGGEFRVNTTTASYQYDPAITALADGGFVVTWMSYLSNGESYDIHAQRYAADGTASGPEFRVNTTTQGQQLFPEITALADGGYLVSWLSEAAGAYGLYAQRFAADGSPTGAEFHVNTTTPTEDRDVTITGLSDGGFVVSWVRGGYFSYEADVYAQRYAADGSPAGPEFRVNTTTPYEQKDAAITALADGGFVVTWMSSYQDNSGYDIYAQRYAADGSASGGEFRVNAATAGSNQEMFPAVTALADGGFVVSWMTYINGDGSDVFARRYAADGSASGPEFRVNTTTTGYQQYSSITALADGGFVISWMAYDDQDGSGTGVYAQRYAADGSAAGGEFLVNTMTADNQEHPTIAGLADGGFVISWASYGQDGDGPGIYAQRYAGAGSDTVVEGTPGNDVLSGTTGNDTIYAYEGDDVVNALGGDDELHGGAGNDTLDGGSGNDTASYADATGSVFAQVGFGADEYDPGFNNYLSSDSYSGIENITGSEYDDELYGDDNANVLDGRGGNDFIQGWGGDDTVYGGDGNDFLQGDRGDNFIGASGNDTIYGEGGNDTLRGGLGDDQIYGGDGNDLMRGNGGVDYFDGGAEEAGSFGDRISFYEQRATEGVVADLRTGVISNDGHGNVETMVSIESLGAGTAYIDTFYGNDGSNFLFGDRGDIVYGFGGDDGFQLSSAAGTLDGGDDTDTMYLNTGGGWLTPDSNGDGLAEITAAATAGWYVNLLAGDMVDGYDNYGIVTGIENVTGSELADELRGDHNNNVLAGAGGDDLIVGHGGDDIVDGGDGSDILRGDAQNYTNGPFGNDTIIGGAGDDLMRGSAGVDYYDGGSDSGGIGIYGGFGDRISFYEVAATAGVVADLRDGTISNDGFGNAETMSGIESLGGDTAYIDTFYGNDERNTLIGGRGDNLYGEGGDDNFSLGVAAAVVAGGDGIDLLQVNSAGGWLMPDEDSDGLAEAAAAVAAGWSIDLAAGTMVDGYGNAGTVTGIENLDGSEQADTLVGDGNANVINGGDGDDTLDGRGGNDTLDGGNGTDTVGYGSAAGPVEVDLGAGYGIEYAADGLTVLSTDALSNIENASGSAYGDVLIGSDGGNNVLLGLGGNDFLWGGTGDDQIDGGDGFDTAAYNGAPGGVTVDLSAGTSSGADGNDTLTGIEAISGSNFDDILIGDSSGNSLTGRGGNDTLIGGDGHDFFRPGAGDDLIDGGAGFDRVSHYGTNILTGVTVDLRIAGPQDTGHGLDTYVGIEALSGTRFGDNLIGDDNDNWLIAADGNDSLSGNGGNDLLTVADGELGAASGNHSIDGGADNDTLDVSWSSVGGTGFTLSLEDQGSAQDSGHGLLTLNNIENLSGSLHDDTLTGDGGANTLSGHAGNDILTGGDGNDSLYGDGALIADTRASSGGSGPVTFFADVSTFDPALVPGNDTLEGGLGYDQLYGGGGNDTASYANAGGAVQAFLYNGGFGEADGADGYDELHDIENLTGSAYNDQLGGNNQANLLSGGDGHDTLRGNAGNDSLLGGEGNDFLNGGSGDDLLDGGAGYDRATYFTGATAGVTVDLSIVGPQDTGQGMDTLVGIENVSGTAFADTLTGDGGDNQLWGSTSTLGDGTPTGSNDDTLDGGGGNDLLTVGTGNHSLTGGSGTDTVAFTENGAIPDPAITVSLAIAGAQATGAGTWTLDGIENLSGGTADDNLTGDGGDNVLAGNTGNDNLSGGDGNDTLYGDGAIQIDHGGGPGTSGPIATFADVTTANPALVPGNDTLEGGLGDDQLYGGGGSDTATYANASGAVQASIFNGGLGEVFGADGHDQLYDIENLIGSGFDDELTGNNAANVIDGLAGNDTIFGNGGNDTLTGGDGNDFIGGGSGLDTITGGAGNDSLSGNQGDDIVIGGDGDDSVFGNPGNDMLYGGDGHDFLRGDNADGISVGDDYIDAGAGFDRVTYYNTSNGVTVDLNLQGGAQDTGQGMDTLLNTEAISGSIFSDVLTGDDNDNWFFIGGAGLDHHTVTSDTIMGNGGNDLIVAGLGNHVVGGGSGTDTLGFIFARTEIFGGVTISLELQGAAQDTGQGSMILTGFENLSGSTFDDNFTGDGGDNMLAGASGSDVLVGGAGNDLLLGDGEVNLSGTNGTGPIATYNEGDYSGLDFYDSSGTIVYLFEGQDLYDSAGNLVPREDLVDEFGSAFSRFTVGGVDYDFYAGFGTTSDGIAGNDVLDGGDGDDTLIAGAGDDTLIGGAGSDTMDGGEGTDTVSYWTSERAVTVDLEFDVAYEYTSDGLSWTTDTLASVESAVGSQFDDGLFGSSGENVLDGGDGSDFIRGRGGDDQIFGGAGNDDISGDFGANVQDGGGNDLVDGGDGNDTVRGRDGDDVVLGGDGNDFVEGGTGDDFINGGDGYDRAGFFSMATNGVTVDLNIAGPQNTGQGMDTLVNVEHVSGTAFNDILIGDGNDNWLRSGVGTDSDTFVGNGGNDLIEVGGGTHTLSGGDGTDTWSLIGNTTDITSAGVTASLAAQGAAQDTEQGMMTATGFENLSGSIHDDNLTGDGNANVLAGDQGNDVLTGGAGNDTLYGDGRIWIDFQGGGGSGPITTWGDVATVDPAFVPGNDVLDGGLGNDTLDGGGGTDTATYANASGGVTVNLGGGFATGADGNDTLVSIENVTGSAHNDAIFGDDGDNLISGGDGDDRMLGADGNDSLLGGDGNDILRGEAGDDLLNGGAGIDRAGYWHSDSALGGITVSLLLQGSSQNTGSQGWDTLLSIENVFGTPFADVLTGDGGNNWLSGSEATLSVGNVSATNADYIDGQGGDDLLSVGIGNHTIIGGSGTDTLWFTEHGYPETGIIVSLAAPGTAQATGNGSWTLTGIENLSGGTANDILTGDGNVNVLGGGAGNDTLVGGGGNDTLYGDGAIAVDGNGVITTFTDVATITLSGIGTDVALLPGASGNDTLEGGLGDDIMHGGGGTDTATYANASGAVTVNLTAGTATGADGNDTLIAIENVLGSAFADTLTGDGNANALNGGNGNDIIDGRAGNDTLIGGVGTDTATYANASGAVTVNLTLGTASGADGSDTLATIENVTGSAFADTLTGDGGANVLIGGDGNDILNGRLGNDTLNGGAGTDTASYANASGAVSVNLGTGSATGADGSDTLISIENAIGSAFVDTLRGDDFANVLSGGAGADTLIAGRGDDFIYGGTGNDQMTGNQGIDRFVMEGTSGTDTVTDFATGIDKIVFDPSSGVTSFSQLTITKVGSDAVVSWAGGSVVLQGVKTTALRSSDFQFGAPAMAAAEISSMSASGAMTGAIAAVGLAELSASAPAYSAQPTDSLASSSSTLHNQSLAPESLGMAAYSGSDFSLASSTQVFDSIKATISGSRDSGLDSSSFGFEGSFLGTAAPQPAVFLAGTSLAMPAGGSPAMTAAAVAIPAAEQLAGLVAPAQSNAIVGKVLADSLGGGSEGLPSIDTLLDGLAAQSGAPTALEALAGIGVAHDSGAGYAALRPHADLAEQLMAYHDAAPLNA